jgi:hypothetical protein
LGAVGLRKVADLYHKLYFNGRGAVKS